VEATRQRSTSLHLGSFIALGCASLILAPSLETFRVGAGVTKGQIGVLFTAGAIGYLLGSFAAGRLLANRAAHHVLAGGLLLSAAVLVGLTAVHNIVPLIALQIVLGAGGGLVDVTGNSLVLWVHKGGPIMNALHLFFGIGATLAPVVVGRSLAWTDSLRAGYFVVAALLVAFAVWSLVEASPPNPHEVGSRGFPAGKSGLLAIAVMFFVLYVGLEVGFIGWIIEYGVSHGFTRAKATWLNTAYLASFTVGRAISIPVASRFSPKQVMFSDLGLCVVAMTVMIAGRDSSAMLWVATALFGLGTASMFPTMMSLTEPHIPSTGAVTSALLIGSSIGSMSIPWTIGALIDHLGPTTLPVIMLISTGLCAGVIVLFLRAAGDRGDADVLDSAERDLAEA
jgi:MFS transporter, FHS family, Na+ dependent glucose transporter 1